MITYRRVQHLGVTKLAEFNGKIVINASRLWIRPEYSRLTGCYYMVCGCIGQPPSVGNVVTCKWDSGYIIFKSYPTHMLILLSATLTPFL